MSAPPKLGLLDRTLGRRRWREARCLYILSTGRTGTTSLEKLLKLTPGMAVYHELAPMVSDVTMNDALHNVEKTPDRFARYFRKHRAAVLGRHLRRDEVFVETNNFQFLAPIVADLLPNARFAHVYRHPADYVRSGMRRRWYVDHPWDPIRLRPAEDDPDYANWRQWTPFEKICWFWKAANRAFLKFVDSQPAEHVTSVKFEELFDGESDVYRQFFDVLGVDPPDETQARRVLETPHNAQQSGDFPLYEDWTDSQRRTLKEIAGDQMQRLDYE